MFDAHLRENKKTRWHFCCWNFKRVSVSSYSLYLCVLYGLILS